MSKVKPLLIPGIVLIFGILLGVLVGYSTVAIADTGPWQLHPEFQALYVMTVAQAYGANGDTHAASYQLGFLCRQEGVEAAIDRAIELSSGDTALKADLEALRPLAPQWTASSSAVCSNQPGGVLGIIRQFLPILGALAVLGVVGYIGYSLYSEGQTRGEKGKMVASRAPTATSARAKDTVSAPTKAPVTAQKAKAAPPVGAPSSAEATQPSQRTAAAPIIGEPPLVQFMTTYLEGDDLFDDSFSIETAAGEFLGETGVGIAEAMGVTEPKRVAALEVWLFDKNDIRTVTKLLASDHAFNDETLKTKLAPKGESVLAQPNAELILETASLRVRAKVIDMEYGSGPHPPNSFFKRITIELAAWKRTGSK